MKLWLVTNPWLDRVPFLAPTCSQVIAILNRIWPGEPWEIHEQKL